MVDQQATERCGIRRVVGKDCVHLAFVIEAVVLEPVGQESAGDPEQRRTARKRDQTPISHEGVMQMDGGVSMGHAV